MSATNHSKPATPPARRPYPAGYVTTYHLRDGLPVVIRPIRPEDEPLMVEFHKTLSDASVRYRYFGMIKLDQRVGHERLTRICFNDYDREIALVVEREIAPSGTSEILGVGRLIKGQGLEESEFAIVISDQWQRHGLGTELLKKLVVIGRAEKLTRIVGHILAGNLGMQKVARKAGFKFRHDADGEGTAEIFL